MSPSCAEGCTCRRHSRPSKIDWTDADAVRAYQRERSRQRYAADPEAARTASRQWGLRNRLYAKYRLTNEAWQSLLDSQNGCCYLCLKPFDVEANRRSIHVDHDHTCCPGEKTCGQCVRGLACWSCNRGIGRFKDDPDRIRRVAENLRAAQLRLRSNN